ncbi:uncharacterized protein [Physcomitrium patens]|uniref:uncharacterized protein isoform X3 n=1 Tax=Physcomitrium patens TaxID=3218 RepID=UPI003CCE39DA
MAKVSGCRHPSQAGRERARERKIAAMRTAPSSAHHRSPTPPLSPNFPGISSKQHTLAHTFIDICMYIYLCHRAAHPRFLGPPCCPTHSSRCCPTLPQSLSLSLLYLFLVSLSSLFLLACWAGSGSVLAVVLAGLGLASAWRGWLAWRQSSFDRSFALERVVVPGWLAVRVSLRSLVRQFAVEESGGACPALPARV